jgi:hypothetical protein
MAADQSSVLPRGFPHISAMAAKVTGQTRLFGNPGYSANEVTRQTGFDKAPDSSQIVRTDCPAAQ